MIVGGYALDLYCDTDNPAHKLQQNYEGDQAQFGGHDRATAVRSARRAGWTINWKTKEARCPICRTYNQAGTG